MADDRLRHRLVDPGMYLTRTGAIQQSLRRMYGDFL